MVVPVIARLLLAGTFCCGFYAAAHNSYRFAATDTASDQFKPKAISFVLVGGVMAAVIGPTRSVTSTGTTK